MIDARRQEYEKERENHWKSKEQAKKEKRELQIELKRLKIKQEEFTGKEAAWQTYKLELEKKLTDATKNLVNEKTAKEKHLKNYRIALLRLAAQKRQTNRVKEQVSQDHANYQQLIKSYKSRISHQQGEIKEWKDKHNQAEDKSRRLETQKDKLQNKLGSEQTKIQQVSIERDNWKQKFEQHSCSACLLKHCPPTHDNYEELLNQESKIVEQLNQELKLGLTEKDKNLEKAITKIKELLAPPHDSMALKTVQEQLKTAETTITDLNKQLADKKKTEIQTAVQKEVIQVVWKEILPDFIYHSLSEELKQVNDYTQLKSFSAKVSQRLLQTQTENQQKAVHAVQSSQNTERFIWIGLLLISLTIIGEMSRKLRSKKLNNAGKI